MIDDIIDFGKAPPPTLVTPRPVVIRAGKPQIKSWHALLHAEKLEIVEPKLEPAPLLQHRVPHFAVDL